MTNHRVKQIIRSKEASFKMLKLYGQERKGRTRLTNL